ncbi:MAG TPA: hypothetical protein ENI23_07190 [bacterium]|nr:hypothetical protein [bacterium]
MSNYQIMGPWREQNSGDGKNIVSKIYVRNTEASGSFSGRTGAQDNDGDLRTGGSDPTAWSTTSGNVRTGAETVFLGEGTFIHAVRFTNVTVPQGSTIDTATLTYTALGTDTNNVLTKMYGFDEDNTADYSSDPTGRTKTTAVVDWDLNGVTNNVTYSFSIATIVQEIINRSGWSSGNAIGFINVDDGSAIEKKHSFQSHDGVSAKAPLLDIGYTPVSRTVLFRGQTRYITPRRDVTIT